MQRNQNYFSIQKCRYEGDEQPKPESDKNHLSELLKRIEERKKQKLAETQKKEKAIKPSAAANAEGVSRKKGKKRKAKSEDGVEKMETDEISKQLELQNEQSTETVDQTDNNNLASQKASQDFTILGTGSRKKLKPVTRVLPRWLTNPEIISADLSSGPDLEDLKGDLDPKLVEILKSNGLVKLFPVQASIVRWLLKCNRDRRIGWWPRDTCVSAPTGSGTFFRYSTSFSPKSFIVEIRIHFICPIIRN